MKCSLSLSSVGQALRTASCWLAEKDFDVFLTVDQNLKFQQNLASFNIALVVLVARNSGFKALRPLMPEVREALQNVKRGDFIKVGAN